MSHSPSESPSSILSYRRTVACRLSSFESYSYPENSECDCQLNGLAFGLCPSEVRVKVRVQS